MIRKLIFFYLFFLGLGTILLAQTSVDTIPEASEYEEEISQEPAEDKDSLKLARYQALMAAVSDTQYSVQKVPQGHFGDNELAEKRAREFDFSEKIPKPEEKKDPDVKKKKSSSLDLMGLFPVLKYLIIGLLVLALAYLVYRIMITGKGESATSEALITWETDPDKIAFEQLESWLRQALTDQNYAYAVRVVFLMVLKDLSKQEIILWKRNKTNRDYLFEIRQPELARSFRTLAQAFDASRYGNYRVTHRSFEMVQSQYQQIQRILNPQQPA